MKAKLKIRLAYLIEAPRARPGPEDESQLTDEVFEISKPTVRGVLDALASKFGIDTCEIIFDRSAGNLRQGVMIAVNGTDIRGLRGIDTELREGDKVTFIRPIGGG